MVRCDHQANKDSNQEASVSTGPHLSDVELTGETQIMIKDQFCNDWSNFVLTSCSYTWCNEKIICEQRYHCFLMQQLFTVFSHPTMQMTRRVWGSCASLGNLRITDATCLNVYCGELMHPLSAVSPLTLSSPRKTMTTVNLIHLLRRSGEEKSASDSTFTEVTMARVTLRTISKHQCRDSAVRKKQAAASRLTLTTSSGASILFSSKNM